MGLTPSKPLTAVKQVEPSSAQASPPPHESVDTALKPWPRLAGTREECQHRTAAAEIIQTCYRDRTPQLRIEYTSITHLPTCMGQFIHLTSLMLSHNQLTLVPNEIINLTQLIHIDLSYNRIEILPDIKKLSHLQTLEVQHNVLSTFPTDLSLPALNKISIEGNPNLALPYAYIRQPRFQLPFYDPQTAVPCRYEDLVSVLLENKTPCEETPYLPVITPPIEALQAGQTAFAAFLTQLKQDKSPVTEYQIDLRAILHNMIEKPTVREAMYRESFHLQQTVFPDLLKPLQIMEMIDLRQSLEYAYLANTFSANDHVSLLKKSREIVAFYRASYFLEMHCPAEVVNTYETKSHFRLNMLYAVKGYLTFLKDPASADYIVGFERLAIIRAPLDIPQPLYRAMAEYITHPSEETKIRDAEMLCNLPAWRHYLLKGGYQEDSTLAQDAPLRLAIEKIQQEALPQNSAIHPLGAAPTFDTHHFASIAKFL